MDYFPIDEPPHVILQLHSFHKLNGNQLKPLRPYKLPSRYLLCCDFDPNPPDNLNSLDLHPLVEMSLHEGFNGLVVVDQPCRCILANLVLVLDQSVYYISTN